MNEESICRQHPNVPVGYGQLSIGYQRNQDTTFELRLKTRLGIRELAMPDYSQDSLEPVVW
jgi:hypothetical protein